MRRWLFIFLAVTLSGWFAPTAHALTRAPAPEATPRYDETLQILVVVVDDGITMDTYEGNNEDPLSLHKYLFGKANPADGIDPSGHDDETIDSAPMVVLAQIGGGPPGIPPAVRINPLRTVIIYYQNRGIPQYDVKKEQVIGLLSTIDPRIHWRIVNQARPTGVKTGVLQSTGYFYLDLDYLNGNIVANNLVVDPWGSEGAGQAVAYPGKIEFERNQSDATKLLPFVTTHEILHAFGVGHTDNPHDVMYGSFSSGWLTRDPYIGPDDRNIVIDSLGLP